MMMMMKGSSRVLMGSFRPLMRSPLMKLSSRGFSDLNLDETIIVTTSCARRIKQLQEKQQTPDLYLRLAVEGGGCSGFKYTFLMESEKPDPEDDLIFTRDGSRVVVDQSSFDLIKGSTVDFVSEMMRSSFIVSGNPQSESACGCGSSFAVKNFAANPALD